MRYWHSLIPHQQRQQIKFRRGKMDRFARSTEYSPVEVDFEISGLEYRGSRIFATGATKYGVKPGNQLTEADGFSDVVIRSSFQSLDHVVLGIPHRHHDDSDIRHK